MRTLRSVWQPLTQRRPLIGVVLTYIAGLLLGEATAIRPLYLFIASALGLGSCLVFREHPRIATPSLCCAILFLAWAHIGTARSPASPLSIEAQLGRGDVSARMIGTVASDPEAFYDTEGRVAGTRFSLRVLALDQYGQPMEASGQVRVRCIGVAANTMQYGDRWALRGVVSMAPDATEARLHVREEGARFLSRGHGQAIVRWCLAGRRASADILSIGLEDYPDHVGILRALLLGYKNELPHRLERIFSETGTLHIFAISGLHVGVVCMLFVAVLRSAGLQRRYWILLLAPLLVAYTIATGMRPSAVRACIMALAFFTGYFFQRRPDPLSALAAAALVILGATPTQLFEPGFIYSFSIVAMLIIMCPVLYRPLARHLQRDTWKIEPESWARSVSRRVALWLGGLAVTSCVAWLASAPLTAYYFNHLSLIALVGNIMVIPASFLVVLSGCLSLCLGGLYAGCAELFNYANVVFISALIAAIERMGSVPFGHFSVKAPPWQLVAAWYGLLACMLVLRAEYRKHAAVCVCVIAVLAWVAVYPHGRVQASAMSARGGHLLLIDLPGRADVLVDAGGDLSSRRTMRMLKQYGVNRLRSLIITDVEQTQIEALHNLVQEIRIDEIWLPVTADPSAIGPFKALERVRVRMMGRDSAGYWPGDVSWEYLHVDEQATATLRIAHDGQAILYAGRLDRRSERSMLKAPRDLTATSLVVGRVVRHPEACSIAWLREVRPRDAILTTDGRASFTVEARLRELGIERRAADVSRTTSIVL